MNEAQIQQMKAEGAEAMWRKSLEYRLNKMEMHDRWQVQEEENVDTANPMTISLYIPETTKLIQQVLLRVKLKQWRSYSWRTRPLLASEVSFVTADGTYQIGTVGTTTSVSGAHSHAGAVPVDGDHDHDVEKHTHLAELPAGMTLAFEHSIYLGTTAVDFRLAINGTDVTATLGGPWTTNQTSLDLTTYVQRGWNDIDLSCSGMGRLHATTYVDLYIPN